MNDDGDTKDDVKMPDGEVGDKITKLLSCVLLCSEPPSSDYEFREAARPREAVQVCKPCCKPVMRVLVLQ